MKNAGYVPKRPFEGKRQHLPPFMNKIYSKTKRLFVIIIDEWDARFRIREEDTEGQIKYLDSAEVLAEYLRRDYDGLQDAVEQLMDGSGEIRQPVIGLPFTEGMTCCLFWFISAIWAMMPYEVRSISQTVKSWMHSGHRQKAVNGPG